MTMVKWLLRQIIWLRQNVRHALWIQRKLLMQVIRHRLRFVRFLLVNHTLVFVLNVMVQTWQRKNRYRLVKQLVLLLLSPSVSRVHSLPCVRSIPVVWPATISHRVFLVSRSFLRQESQRDLLLFPNLQEKFSFVTPRRNVKWLLQMMKPDRAKHIWFHMVPVLKYWKDRN